VRDGVPIDSETLVVTLSISRSARSVFWTQCLGGTHRSRMCVCSWGECMYICLSVASVLCFAKKIGTPETKRITPPFQITLCSKFSQS
jgi:hypothetical protein